MTFWYTQPAVSTGRERTSYYLCPTRGDAERLQKSIRSDANEVPVATARIFERHVKVDRAALPVFVLSVRRKN